ncbi:MAG TPA: Ig-like domain-containing protein [Candidatus Limnocylindria bacterium]|nr:Ig-like domain-containing protein [Candidatus Limnocylindria bacterium]
MPDRIRSALTLAVGLAMAWTVLGTVPVEAANPLKVVIIVGPTGALTDSYRQTGNAIAGVATAAGAEVVKVYSPRATWPRVRNAVAGANVVVYLGHGNGSPSPYSSSEWPDRNNGWGLNRTTKGGDSDDWSTKMVYCGEEALLGTLTSSDGAAQWNHCGGRTNTDGIAPAADWVMIYNKACYAPGAGEGWDVKATESVAFQRVRNYSYPALKAGAGAYFATDMYQGGQQLVDLVLRHRDWTFGAITEAANGYSSTAQRRDAHPDLVGREVWIQRTTISMGTDYWLAYAGRPSLTPSGADGVYVSPPGPTVVSVNPPSDALNVPDPTTVRATFDQPVTGLNATSFTVTDLHGLSVPGSVSFSAGSLTAAFTATVAMEPGTTYTARLSTDVRGAVGKRLAAYAWRFTMAGALKASVTAYQPSTPLSLGAGTNTGYKFTLDGKPTLAKHATLATASMASTSLRRTIAGQAGAWFYVTSGRWKGYWLRESDAVSLPGGSVAAVSSDQVFNPPARVGAKKGTHTAYTFDASGAMTGTRTSTGLYREGNAAELRALPGQTGQWFRMTSGPWKGYWLRASTVVTLVSGG